MPDFYTVVTDTGLQALGLATTQGQSFSLTHAVVGDGNGVAVVPNKSMANLVNEVWRGNVAGIKVDPEDPNTLIFEFAIPADTGGFTIREVGLLDESGKLFCIGNFPDTEKPVAADGSVRDLVVRLPLHFENADVVNLVINAAIVLATKQDIADHNEDPEAHRRATEEVHGFTQYATPEEHKAKTAKNRACNPFGVWELLKHVMSSAYTSTSTITIATSKAVSSVYTKFTQHTGANDPHGVVAKVKALLTSSITSSSTTTFATPKAVKTVQDNLNAHDANAQAHRLATEERTGFIRLATAAEHPQSNSARRTLAATPYGVWQLFLRVKNDAVNSGSTYRFATSRAVKTVMDALNGHKSANDPHGVVAKVKALLTSSVTSTSTTTFATPKGVKIAYDKAVAALNTANSKCPVVHNHDTKYASKSHSHSYVLKINIRTFTSSGTYNKPSNLLFAEVIVTGGGAGGSTGTCGAGGGAGGTSIKTYNASELAASEPVVVAAGGNTNTNGGNSAFKYQAGNGGKVGVASVGGLGGLSSGGDLNLIGGGGDGGDTAGIGGVGGSSYWGGAGRGTNNVGSRNGSTGGGGGGADDNVTTAGTGGTGLVVIKEYLR